MKKILSVVAALVLTLSMAAASVSAAETSESSAQLYCSHSSGTVTDTIIHQEYAYIDNASHGYVAIDYVKCKTCLEILDMRRYYVNRAGHKTGKETYCGSNHSGNYTEHYYTYRSVCEICNGTVERTGKTGCTAKHCIEPQ